MASCVAEPDADLVAVPRDEWERLIAVRRRYAGLLRLAESLLLECERTAVYRPPGERPLSDQLLECWKILFAHSKEVCDG